MTIVVVGRALSFVFHTVLLRYIGSRILAHCEIACDPAVAATFLDQFHDLRRKLSRWTHTELAAKLLATCLGGSKARFHPLADQVAFKFRNTGEKGRQLE